MNPNNRLVVFIAFGVSGFAALIYEVVWFRAISLVIGSSLYAASAMLSAFIAGLAFGGWLGGYLADRAKAPFFYFGLLQLAIAVACLITLPLIQNLSHIYAVIFYNFRFYFFPFLFVQFLIIFCILFIPTVLMGIAFPMALKIRGNTLSGVGLETGKLFAINSFGAIGGSIMAGLILLPALGIKNSIIFAASVNLLIAILILINLRKISVIVAGSLVFIGIAYVLAFLEPHPYYFNYYIAERVPSYEEFLKRRDYIERLYYEDNAQATVEVFGVKGSNVRWLVNGGHPEGSINTQDAGKYTQILLAAIPLGIKKDAQSYLEVGLGPGNTLKAASLYSHLKDIACIEINPAVIRVNKSYFYPELFEDRRISFIEADARNFMQLTRETYDVIVAQPSEATEFHSANLFTKEFYTIAKSKLTPSGIFAQYISYYFLTKEEGQMMFKTWASVFPEVYAWYLTEKGIILIGSNEKLAIDGNFKETVNGKLFELKDKLGLGEIQPDFFWLGAGPDVVRRSLDDKSMPVNTDDRPLYEFMLSRNILKGERYLDTKKKKITNQDSTPVEDIFLGK